MNSLLETAIRAALEAGKKISEIYHDPEADFEIERKADNSPLTVADRKSNEIIMAYLEKTPYPVISEENKHVDFAQREAWKIVWIVDPLDGTKEFIKRNGEFTVNIALVYEGRPALGVIYIPERNTLYYGTLKDGAWKVEDVRWENGMDFAEMESRAVRLPLERKKKGFVVVASRSHLNAETEAFLARLEKEHGEVSLASVGCGNGSVPCPGGEGTRGSEPGTRGQFHQDMPCGRRERGYLPAFCSHDGMGHGGRACHREGGREGCISGGRHDTIDV